MATVAGEQGVERVKAAAQMYDVYGFPLLYNLKEISGFAEGRSSLPFEAPWNASAPARELCGKETEMVSPNNDTLYLFASLDLGSGPLVVHVPDTADRYYVLSSITKAG